MLRSLTGPLPVPYHAADPHLEASAGRRDRSGVSIVQAALVAAGIVLLAVAAVAATARRRLTVVVVDGESMSPALHSGDRVLVTRRAAGLSVGDVVVFRYPSGPDGKLIKRVAAVAGDLVPQDVLRAVQEQPGARVPPGLLVVIGDGPQSADSRDFGYLSAEQVIGVAVRRLGAPGERGPVPARTAIHPPPGSR